MTKIKYKTPKVIECSDWDDLIIETYDKSYCFQQQDDCQPRGNHRITIENKPYNKEEDPYPDSIPFEINGSIMGVSFETWLKTTEEDINKKMPETYPGSNNLFWDRNFYPDLQIIANDLCHKGLIEPGEYVIEIDW